MQPTIRTSAVDIGEGSFVEGSFMDNVSQYPCERNRVFIPRAQSVPWTKDALSSIFAFTKVFLQCLCLSGAVCTFLTIYYAPTFLLNNIREQAATLVYDKFIIAIMYFFLNFLWVLQVHYIFGPLCSRYFAVRFVAPMCIIQLASVFLLEYNVFLEDWGRSVLGSGLVIAVFIFPKLFKDPSIFVSENHMYWAIIHDGTPKAFFKCAVAVFTVTWIGIGVYPWLRIAPWWQQWILRIIALPMLFSVATTYQYAVYLHVRTNDVDLSLQCPSSINGFIHLFNQFITSTIRAKQGWMEFMALTIATNAFDLFLRLSYRQRCIAVQFILNNFSWLANDDEGVNRNVRMVSVVQQEINANRGIESHSWGDLSSNQMDVVRISSYQRKIRASLIPEEIFYEITSIIIMAFILYITSVWFQDSDLPISSDTAGFIQPFVMVLAEIVKSTVGIYFEIRYLEIPIDPQRLYSAQSLLLKAVSLMFSVTFILFLMNRYLTWYNYVKM